MFKMKSSAINYLHSFVEQVVQSCLLDIYTMAIGGWEQDMRRAADDSLQTLQVNWHLGFTSFGGPPVHFKIVSQAMPISI